MKETVDTMETHSLFDFHEKKIPENSPLFEKRNADWKLIKNTKKTRKKKSKYVNLPVLPYCYFAHVKAARKLPGEEDIDIYGQGTMSIESHCVNQ